MLFRAQDRHLPRLLEQYAAMCEDEQHCRVIHAKRDDVIDWQMNNNTKEPDTDLSGYDLGPGDIISEPDPVGDAMDGVLASAGIGRNLEEPLQFARERQKIWDVTVRGPELVGRHPSAISTKVDDAGYLHIEMQDGKSAIYNRSEWACITKEPR